MVNQYTQKKIPLYIIIPVWGDEYVTMMLNYLLSSLLSPNNIPALSNREECKVIFVSNDDSYNKLLSSNNYRLLSNYITVEYIKLTVIEGKNKFTHLTLAYKQGTDVAKKVNAACVYLTADHIVSDGSLVFLQNLANEGKGVVLLPGPRINLEPFVKFTSKSKCQFSPRELAGIIVDNLHEEYQRYKIDHRYFVANPHILIKEMHNQKGLYVKAFQQHPILVNLSVMPEKLYFDLETAIDINFVNDNLDNTNLLYHVTDSDKIVACSLTSVNDCIPDLTSPINESKREQYIKDRLVFMMYCGHVNRMHEHSFINTYILHTEDLTDITMVQDNINQFNKYNKLIRDYSNDRLGYKILLQSFVYKTRIYCINKVQRYKYLHQLLKSIYSKLKNTKYLFKVAR